MSGSEMMCKTCGEQFTPTHHSQRYCCPEHNPGILSIPEQRVMWNQFINTVQWFVKYNGGRKC